ncbi:S9 family peptidase [Flaviaesturariibacter amylovorans]|uniref:S9 family peptidase n=1 Tax=Flaviaesturariibacter amylovorans TaxID=1084520 RepID=A0ABP8HH76_9BACT
MKTTFLLPAALLLALASGAQQKALSLEDALVRNRSTLAPASLRGLQFIHGTDQYAYLKGSGSSAEWVRGSFKGGEQSLITLASLNDALRRTGCDTFATMPDIRFDRPGGWFLSSERGRFRWDPVKSSFDTLVPQKLSGKEVLEESGGGYTAYVDGHNLYVSDGRTAKAITADGSANIVYGSAVHRNEFGISKGTFWSPDGKQLAFYRMDQSMVRDYPIIDWAATPAKVNLVKYPMAGDASHHVSVGVYHAATGDLVFLQTGAPLEQYLTNIAWSPDGRYVYIAVVNRGQDHMRLNQYDAATGAFVKTLFEERDTRYVEPLAPMAFVKGKPGQFVWQSNRDGYNHLYLYDTSGRLIRQLTKGPWEVLELKGFDAKGEALFYTSTEVSPLCRNLYRLDLRTGAAKGLTPGVAVHAAQVSSSGAFVLDSYSSPAQPRTVRLLDVASGKEKVLFAAPDPLAGYALGTMRIGTISADDGTPLYTRTYLPAGFDSTRKYPVVVYWYGGPHAQLITAGYNGGAGDYWFQYMAGQGYLVFSLDTRGSDNRGRAFESVIHRRTGAAQVQDMDRAVTHLRSLPYVDARNMALFGWSYGGYLTIQYLQQRPGTFKAGIAGGPVTDWRLYEIMYGERYMDTPQENPEGYAATDLTKTVDRLKDKLLLIHGLQDDVVVQQHSVRFVRAAIDKGVQVDYMIYPGHAHNVLGRDRAHLYGKVTDYIRQQLR